MSHIMTKMSDIWWNIFTAPAKNPVLKQQVAATKASMQTNTHHPARYLEGEDNGWTEWVSRHPWLNHTWWRHQMVIFFLLLALGAGNLPVKGEFPTQRPVTRSFAVFIDPRPNKPLSKQTWGWWFETLLRSLCRHCDELTISSETAFTNRD